MRTQRTHPTLPLADPPTPTFIIFRGLDLGDRNKGKLLRGSHGFPTLSASLFKHMSRVFLTFRCPGEAEGVGQVG